MKRTALALFLSAIFLAGCSHPQPVYMAPPPPALSPSSVFQQGTHDGFEAARRDVAEGRPPIFDHHPRFRHPPVPPPAFGDYRQGFREGYNQFLHQGRPPAPPAY
jgi:hypothetical protein